MKTHKKLLHAQTDWCHKVSREIADKYDVPLAVVCLSEDVREPPQHFVVQAFDVFRSAP